MRKKHRQGQRVPKSNGSVTGSSSPTIANQCMDGITSGNGFYIIKYSETDSMRSLREIDSSLNGNLDISSSYTEWGIECGMFFLVFFFPSPMCGRSAITWQVLKHTDRWTSCPVHAEAKFSPDSNYRCARCRNYHFNYCCSPFVADPGLHACCCCMLAVSLFPAANEHKRREN